MEHFAHKKTDGFTLQRIQFETPLSEGSPVNVPELHQTFRYLDCGNQCYAFVSEDNNYVLKFFKYAHPPIPHSLTKIPVLSYFKPFRPHRYEKMIWKKERDLRGYRLAFESFREETALIAVHLDPIAAGYPSITLIDKIGCRHTLDLNKTPFILQKKATSIYAQLKAWLAAGKPDLAREGISNLRALLKKRISLNLQDDDVHFYSNFGFIGTTPVQLDPGHFTSGTYANPDQELKEISEELVTWCAKHALTLP